ncbi:MULTISPECIES: hypothetical protein [unclassified Flavobacterium]|uniref:hypothetical protein n=1 Tax=unclassified Flavobacterium TaxID=196869 RepID=UPI00131E1110|nr:hypothetical protein [Flavobacterium sp. I-STPP5a]
MNANVKKRIDEIKSQGYNIDFGDVFNQTIENYKKIAMYGGLVLFMFFVVFVLGLSGIFSVIFGTDEALTILKSEDFKPENLDLYGLLILSLISIAIGTLVSPFIAGLFKMAHNADKDEEFHVSTMFHYYKSPYFQEIVIATFLLSVLDSLIRGALNYVEIPLLGAVISVIISLFTFLTIPLIIFGNLKAINAIESSVIVVAKQPLILFALLIVGIIAVILGIFGCCIGILFTIPFIYAMIFVIYKYIIGFPENIEEEVPTNFESF